MFMEPAHDQPAPAKRQRAWDTPDSQGWDSWSSARDYWTAAADAPDPWAPAPPPTLTSISADVNHAWDVVKRTETEVGIIRNELRYARVSVFVTLCYGLVLILSEQRDSARQIQDLTISNQFLTTIVSMQTAQLDRMERMFQTHLNNTQMAHCTSASRQTEAPSLSAREMQEQVRQAPSPRRSAGGPPGPSFRVRGFRSCRGCMEDVD